MNPRTVMAHLSGKARKRGAATTLPEAWKKLADKAGGVSALAKRCGVTRTSIRRWANGEIRIAGPSAIVVQKLSEEFGVPCPIPDAPPAKPEPLRVATKSKGEDEP